MGAQKATAALERTRTIELVISEENDYGIGKGSLFFQKSCEKASLSFTHAAAFLPFIRSVLAAGGIGVAELFGYQRHHRLAPAPSARQVQAALKGVPSIGQLPRRTRARASERGRRA